ncbi:vomeronasal type-2 receptor 116-like, partial [Sigmodon hispidus]
RSPFIAPTSRMDQSTNEMSVLFGFSKLSVCVCVFIESDCISFFKIRRSPLMSWKNQFLNLIAPIIMAFIQSKISANPLANSIDINIRTQSTNETPNTMYQFALPLAFAIYEVNKNPDILPNMSLVFISAKGGCRNVLQLQSILQASAQNYEFLPNYMCYKIECILVLTGPYWATSAITWRILDLYQSQQWDDATTDKIFTLDTSFGTIVFAPHHAEIFGFKNFVQMLTHHNYSDNFLAKLQWMKFNCEDSASKGKIMKNCSSNTSLEWLEVQTFDMAFSDDSYDVYNAVYAAAHALHEMNFQQEYNQPMNNRKKFDINCLKMCKSIFKCIMFHLYSFLKKTHFTNPVGEKVNINKKEKLMPDYDIFQTWNFLHGLELKVKIGIFSPYFPHGQQLHLSDDHLDCHFVSLKMPPSVCNADCGPGFRKFVQEGIAVCCFDCILCPENEISNETNVHQCVKCPEHQYANTEQNQCIDKVVIFMTYGDPLGLALALIALCFSAFTAVILAIFVKHHDTPIVKANNRNLSYTLLISLIFCFLCPLLFIGQPNSVTCILQQISFGVVFTVAISTVLAKTITVLLAFTVTAPGIKMRYFLLTKIPNYITVICTIIQIIFCAIWLGVSPPSIDIDAHFEHGHTIIVCNKGSAIAFYCVLVYHGSLALASFIVAFLARNLPDTFNEAKLLTFSMLIFFSVWVTFLPVYHSTKGKVMVSVEILSILSSSAGLLGCIFFLKCYIILLRPERNYLQKGDGNRSAQNLEDKKVKEK